MASHISLIIPTYKEDGLSTALDHLTEHLLEGAEAARATYEILVIDDSPESYREAIRGYIEATSAHLLPRVEIRLLPGPGTGKGAAVRAGALASRGDIVFTMDADLPIPLDHVERFLEIFERTGCDVVIAERPFDRNLSEPVRFVLSRGLFVFQRVLVLQSRAFVDTQCGFKAYRGDVIRSIASRQIVDGGMYDIEYLYVAMRDGAKIEHVGVTPNAEKRASKINVWKCMYVDPVDLLRVKAKGVRGGYRKGTA